MNYGIGIDLGTTNCSAAVFRDGRAVVIPNSSRHTATPSAVLFKDGACPVGEQALANRGQAVTSVLRNLVTDKKITVSGKSYLPQTVLAMILRKIKLDAEAWLGESVSEAVIAVPALFTLRQWQAVKDAAKIAGLNVRRIMSDTTAEALAYSYSRKNESMCPLICDFGGGSLSVSTLEISDGILEVLGYEGSNRLGGDDLDLRLMRYLAEQSGIDFAKDKGAAQRLRDRAEKAKIELSRFTQTYVDIPGADPVTVTRAKFEELIADVIDETRSCVKKAVEDAGSIDRVILTGGSAHIPAFQKAVRSIADKETVFLAEADRFTAIGAAIYGAVLEGEASFRNILILDALPGCVGIGTLNGEFTPIVKRNFGLPIKAKKEFTTSADGQTSVSCSIFESEDEKTPVGAAIGSLQLSGLAPAKKGAASVEVCIEVDTDGKIVCTMKDKATGKEQRVDCTAILQLPESEIKAAAEVVCRKVPPEQCADAPKEAKQAPRQRACPTPSPQPGKPTSSPQVHKPAPVPQKATATSAEEYALMLLPILDNFERAFEAECRDKEWEKGIVLVYRQLTEGLARLGVTEVDATGKFDPACHNAVMVEYVPGKAPGDILQVLNKGYRIGDKIIRYTMVKVAK